MSSAAVRCGAAAVGLVVAIAARAPAARAETPPPCAALTAALAADAERAARWNTGWTLAFAAAAVGQAAVAGATAGELSEANRAGLWVGAVKASIGVAARVALPLDVPVAPGCAEAPRALAVARRRERNALWLNAVGGLAVNTAGALYLGLARDAWRPAAASFVVGTVVSVASIWSMPRGARRVAVTIVPAGAGLAIAGAF